MTEKPSLEVIAPSVEEAIARGASELGVATDELHVEILDEGSKGLLGMGTRQARVRLQIREEGLPSAEAAPEPRQAEAAAAPERQERPDSGSTLQLAQEAVEDLLHHMSVQATASARWGEADGPEKPSPLFVDIKGQDLSLLIGRRGETLDALQYILRLILGKELQAPIPVIVDVEGYRARREQTLRRLARRMADQALERKRTLSLEPMPPNERRIIHIELRDYAGVRTESVGEGDRRKVTIIPT